MSTRQGSKAAAIPPKSPAGECTDPVKSAKKWSGCPPAIYNGFRGRIDLMTRITTYAVFAFLVSSYPALAEESNGTGPVRLNAPRVEAPPPVIKPKLLRSPPAAGNVGASQDAPQPQSRTDRPPLTGMEQQPSSAVQQVRPRAVYREVGRRIKLPAGSSRCR